MDAMHHGNETAAPCTPPTSDQSFKWQNGPSNDDEDESSVSTNDGAISEEEDQDIADSSADGNHSDDNNDEEADTEDNNDEEADTEMAEEEEEDEEDSDSDSDADSEEEQEKPYGLLRVMVNVLLKGDLSEDGTLREQLHNSAHLSGVVDSLKEEVQCVLQYAKEIRSSSVWKKIKATQQKLVDEVRMVYFA